jgi:hypothetical protein
MALINRLAADPFWRFFAKYWYPYVACHGADDLVFLNWGYEEDPPVAVPLAASDESNRFPYPALPPHGDPGGSQGQKRYWRSVAATAAEPRTSCVRWVRPPTPGWT